MLRLLSGATHRVITGVALLAPVPSSPITEVAAEVTWVTMLTPTEEDLARYIATREPRGKAGAYAIQGQAARWIPASTAAISMLWDCRWRWSPA